MKIQNQKKAQVAIEFIIMVSFSIIISISLAWVAYYFLSVESENSYLKSVKDVGLVIQNEIILASTVETGYQREFNIPSQIGGRPLTISNNQDEFKITYNGADIFFKIPEIQGTLTIGQNIITKQGTIVAIS